MPNSDCKDVRSKSSEFSSYNKRFFAHFMGRSASLTTAFLYFCEVVFAGTPEVLCTAWNMKCCEGSCGLECVRKWADMKEYTKYDLLEELGIKHGEE